MGLSWSIGAVRFKSSFRAMVHSLWKSRRKWAAKYRALSRLPVDLPIGNHGYGAKLIALSVNLARAAGLRASEQCLKLCFEYLGVDENIPDWTTTRSWLQRLGVAAMTETLDNADDWIWMADHSNQIGQEKVLAVLAIRASEMPPPGTAITPEQVHVLTVQPGRDWKREDVAQVYQQLADRYGSPRAVLSDGAVELQDSVGCWARRAVPSNKRNWRT